MKKTVVLFLVAALLLSTMIPAVAGSICNVVHGTSPRWVETNRQCNYTSNGSSGHTKTTTILYICEICKAYDKLSTNAETVTTNENHSLSRSDLGHIAGTRTHRWRSSCSLCSYSTVMENTCINCPSVNSIEPEID